MLEELESNSGGRMGTLKKVVMVVRDYNPMFFSEAPK